MNTALSKRDRDALGAEYRGYARRKRLPGEAAPITRTPQAWVPLRDLQWQTLRQGAHDAAGVPRRGMQT